MSDVNKKLTEGQYWRWRNAITEMWLADQKLKYAELELKCLSKEVEILQAKMQVLAVASVKARKSEASDAKSIYFDLKSELEKMLDTKLDNKVIDDITFEIKELEPEPTDSASVH